MNVQRIAIGFVGAGVLIGTGIFLAVRPARVAQAEVSATRTPQVFSPLASNESAVLDYKTRGCFHSQHYRFEYSPLPTPRVIATDLSEQYQPIPGTKHWGIVAVPKRLGTVTLTPAQVTRFDELLRFYRTNKEGGCTTHDSLIFTTFRDKQKQSVENFDDRSCATYDLADADARDIHAMGSKGAPVLSIRVLMGTAAASARCKIPLPYKDIPRKKTRAYVTARRKQADEIGKRTAKQMAAKIPGYSHMAEQFQITDTDLGYINTYSYSLSVDLQVKSPSLIDRSCWYDPVTNNHPRYDWDQFMRVHSSIEKLVARFAWLRDWKKAGKGRTIYYGLVGLTPNTGNSSEEYVLPAWQHAGLTGRPFCEITLMRADRSDITVYLGLEEKRALITSAENVKADKTDLPIDQLQSGSNNAGDPILDYAVHYHPADKIPDYVTVSPDGTVQRNTRPDTTTRTRFIKENHLHID